MRTTAITFAGLALAASLNAQGYKTSEESYLLATPGSNFEFEPILTVGDRVPLTNGGAGDRFAFVGIPDAMGIYRDGVSKQNILFVAHELGNTTLTTPIPGQTPFRGAFVSRFVLGNDGGIVSAAPAHAGLFMESAHVANQPPKQGSTAAFTRFCSGSFAGTAHGLDRPIFFTNEETFGAASYDSKGAMSVAIADGNLYTLPALGRVGRETMLVQPRRDTKTVIISTEDAGSPSYVYMYVGKKLPGKGPNKNADVIEKNGLSGGKVYVLCGKDAQHNEGTFTTGTLAMQWREIPGASDLNDQALLTAADAAGAFGFVRVEDTEFDPAKPTHSLFLATTGGSGPNRLGRLYELNFTPAIPAGPCSMTVVYNADHIITPGGTYTGASTGSLVSANGGSSSRLGNYTGGDINAGVDFPVSVDNIAVSKDFIVIQEDTNSPANAVYSKYGRNSGLWTLDRNNNYAARLESTFNYAYIESRDGLSSGFFDAGRFESSGVVVADDIFGPGTFVVNVQGHNRTVSGVTSGRTNAPGDTEGTTLTASQFRTRYAEDGQVLIMRPKSAN